MKNKLCLFLVTIMSLSEIRMQTLCTAVQPHFALFLYFDLCIREIFSFCKHLVSGRSKTEKKHTIPLTRQCVSHRLYDRLMIVLIYQGYTIRI